MNDGSLPKAPFSLSSEGVALANERLNLVKVPTGFDWNPQPFFFKPSSMKSHLWKHVAIHGVLKYSLRGLLGKAQQQTLFQLYDILARLCAEEVRLSKILALEREVHEVLASMERDFPLSLQVIVVHLLHHLPAFISRFGQFHSFSMYPFERFNSWITKRVLNRRYPESAVVETYRLFEWAHFMELTKQLPDDACITPSGSFLNASIFEDSSVGVEDYQLSQEEPLSVARYYSDVGAVIYSFADISAKATRLKWHIRRLTSERRVKLNSIDSDSDNSYTCNT